ncbi:MAG: zinc ABC transporter substrate-binding protein [Gemmatales bacterium]|nr:MAG: zinc ABC transporter substrate-binding protein [Gemmatales bacterium]
MHRKQVVTQAMQILCVTFTLAIVGCGHVEDPWPAGSPRILVSIPPLYCFAKNVAGDEAAVVSVLTTTGPHHFHPSSHDVIKLRKADVFFIVGLELDDAFAEKMKGGSGNPNLPIVALGTRVKNKLTTPGGPRRHGDHVHGEFDPHAWLGIPEAAQMVKAIAEELARIDPANSQKYKTNADRYVKRLEDIEDYGKKALAGISKDKRKIVTFHDSLRYFARTFDLHVVDVVRVNPNVEATSQELKQLVDVCKQNHVRVVAIEPQYQTDAANRLVEILQEQGIADVKLVTIDPMETVVNMNDFDADYYERKMKENIDRLAEGLR